MPSIDMIISATEKKTDSPEISRTTASKAATPKIPSVIVSKQVNPLHQFRSYNYLFTLACVKANALKDPALLRKSADYYVIAKSSGKGSDAIKLDDSFNTSAITPQVVSAGSHPDAATSISPELFTRNFAQEYMDAFNTRSSGRFDFFINNVEIETLMSPSQEANASLATKIKFEIYEPYSLNGFMEAIQTAALAAGHVNYAQAPFLLKMEFIGYPDTDEVASETVKKLGAEGTRYFVFSFTNLTVDATESGTRYQCEAVPHNERAYGKPNELTANIKISGKTVGEILDDFKTQINKAKEEESKQIRGDKPVKADKYDIVLPSWSGSKIDITTPNAISKADVTTLSRTNNNYKFADPGTDGNKTVAYVPGKTEVQFSDTIQIHDCIAAIIRDSDYTKNLIKSIESGSKTVMVDGLVDYFIISIESVPQGIWDEESKRELYTYTYTVSPYKIHYTRIPLYESKTVDGPALTKLARREYNYLYTGKNVDVQKFNLKFDNLYFQAIPKGMGNNSTLFSSANGQDAEETPQITLTGGVTQSNAQKNSYALAPVYSDASVGTSNPQKGSGNKKDPTDPYTSMVVNMHQAILDNLSMISAEITILGDPFYLVTSGMGNYKPEIITYGETVDNEAAYQQGDVFVVVNFRNPIDIDTNTGLLQFDSKLVPFSGVFRVISVNSTFKDGLFEQRLQLLRVPGQPIDTNQAVETEISPVTSTPNPASAALANLSDLQTINRITEQQLSLLGSSVNGQLTSLVGGLTGGLTGAIGGLTGAIGGVTGAVNGAIGGLTGAIGNVSGQLTSQVVDGINFLANGTTLVNDATSLLQKTKLIPTAVSEINKLAYSSILEDATSAANQLKNPISISGISDSLTKNILPPDLLSTLPKTPSLINDATGLLSQSTNILTNAGSALSNASNNLLLASGANSSLSISDQLAVGSAEVMNKTNQLSTTPLTSVAVQFGSKTEISPLLKTIIKP
jgi:hypothetical protein